MKPSTKPKRMIRKPRRPTKASTGGHTALTPELQKRICDAIRMGNYVETAVGAAGICKQTYYRWIELAKTGKQPYLDFSNALELAETEGEQLAVLQIRKLAGEDRDGRTLLEMLARRNRKRWARSDNVTVGAAEGQSGTVEIKMTFDGD